MAASGLLVETDDHAEQLLGFAEDMLEASQAVRNPATGGRVQLRVGIHSGRVMVSEEGGSNCGSAFTQGESW